MIKYYLIFISLPVLVACTKDRVEQKTVDATAEICMDTISFSSQVLPIMQQNCSTTGCHDAGSSTGYEFTNHSTISGSAEVALSAMKHEPGVQQMPQGAPKLEDAVIQNFECWINQGKQNN